MAGCSGSRLVHIDESHTCLTIAVWILLLPGHPSQASHFTISHHNTRSVTAVQISAE